MRDFIVLVLVCVVVVVGVGWYLLPGSHNLFRTTVAVQPTSPEPEKPAPPPEKPHKIAVAAHKTEKAPAAAVELAPIPAPTIVPVAIMPAQPKPVVVPRAGDVALGADRSRILDSYGDPGILVCTADRGHFFETMVYGRERKQAIIRLEDGIVSAVYAK